MAKDNHVLHNQPEICLECFHCYKYIPGFLQISWLSFSKHHFNKLTDSFTANQYEEPKFDSPVIYLLPSKTLNHIRFPLFISTLRTLHLLRARSSVFISLWECMHQPTEKHYNVYKINRLEITPKKFVFGSSDQYLGKHQVWARAFLYKHKESFVRKWGLGRTSLVKQASLAYLT